MATLLNIDESPLDQTTDGNGNVIYDSSAALPAAFAGLGTALETAFRANVVTFGANTTDVAFTGSGGTALNGLDSELNVLSGEGIYLYTSGTNNNLVLGRVGSGGAADPAGAVAFAIYLQTNGSPGDLNATSGGVWVAEYLPLQHPIATDSNDFVTLGNKLFLAVSNPIDFNPAGAPSGQNLFLMFGDGTPSLDDVTLVVTAKGAVTSGSITAGATVNTGQGGGATTIGDTNQMVDPHEGMYFTFVKGANVDYTVKNLDQNEADVEANIAFQTLFSASTVSFTVVQEQPTKMATVRVSALNPSDGQTWTGNDYIDHQDNNTAVDISSAVVTRSVVVKKVTYIDTYTFNADGVATSATRDDSRTAAVEKVTIPVPTDLHASFAGNDLVLDGIKAGDTITYTAPDHVRVLITNDGNATNAILNSSFDIGKFKIMSGGTTLQGLGDINFYDDGPAAALTVTSASAITDESVGADSSDTGLAAANDEDGHSAALVIGATLIGYDREQLVQSGSTTSGGTDGTASSVYSLVMNSTTSGLSTTAGDPIVLTQAVAGGDIIGKVGSVAVFAISIDQSGNVTVEQYGSIRHSPVGTFDNAAYLAAMSVYAKLTVTDNDNDTASSQVDISGRIGFEDDGPTATLSLNSVTLTVDESVGADAGDVVSGSSKAAADDETAVGAPTGAIGYATLSGSSLFTTASSTGEDDEGATSAYSLRIDAATTALSVSDSTLDASHSAISLVAVNAQQVEGRYNGGVVAFRITIDATSGAVSLAQFAALDHPTAPSSFDEAVALGTGKLSAVLTVTDGDGDVAAPAVDLGAIMSFEDDGPSIVEASGPDLQVPNVLGTYSEDYDLDGGSDSLASVAIVGVTSNGLGYRQVDSNTVIGTYGTGPGAIDIYQLDINNAGTYDFQLLHALPGSTTKLDTGNIKAGGPDTNYIDVGALDPSDPTDTGDFVRIAGYFDADGPGGNPRAPAAINESNANVGVQNGNLDANETLVISLYDANGDDVAGATAGNPLKQAITGITIGTKTPSITHYLYTAYLNGTAVTGMTNVPYEASKNGAIVINAPAGVYFDTIDLTAVDANAVKIGLGDIEIRRLPVDQFVTFDISLTDSDGDSVGSSFNVAIDGNGDGTYPTSSSALSPFAINSALPVDSTVHATGFDAFATLHSVDAPLV